MAIVVNCGECGNRFDVPDDAAGMLVSCSACEKPVEVPNKVARVALSTAKYMPAMPEVHLTKDQIRKVAKRRAMISAVERKKRNVTYATFAVGGGGSLVFAGFYLMWFGGALAVILALVLLGICAVIKGIFDFINNQAAESELDEEPV